jgi:hypothetical protein
MRALLLVILGCVSVSAETGLAFADMGHSEWQRVRCR